MLIIFIELDMEILAFQCISDVFSHIFLYHWLTFLSLCYILEGKKSLRKLPNLALNIFCYMPLHPYSVTLLFSSKIQKSFWNVLDNTFTWAFF